MMDVLSDVLTALKLKGCLYFTTRFHAPWGIQVPQYRQVARFHWVVSGRCCIRTLRDDRLLKLERGDMVIIPHGMPHILSDDPDSTVASLDQAIAESGYPGYGTFEYGARLPKGEPEKRPETNLICGHMEFDEQFTHPLIPQLPDAIVARSEQMKDVEWFSQAILNLTEMQQSPQMGNDAIVQKLSEIIFIQGIRSWQQGQHSETGFLYALADPHIGPCLQCIHENPEYKWNLSELASKAGLSRTVLAERFKALVGIPPMQYVTEWRIQHAQYMLKEGRQSVDQIAEQVGYESVSAFTRMFKKIVGSGPGAYRKQHHN